MVPFSCTFALPTSFSGIGSGANMSTFALLRRNGSVKFDVERVDLNIWVLPALFWRHIYMCDIGVCCRLLESPNDQSMNFELRAPFASDNSTPIDLTPMMRDDENLCGLIFGNSDLKRIRDGLGTWINDDYGRLLLTDIQSFERMSRTGTHSHCTSWVVSTEPMSLDAGTRLYLRFRITTRTPKNLWIRQFGAGRNPYAVCDIRVNEFREKKKNDYIDFSKVIEPHRINGFLILSARYKSGRISPSPKYIRVLEAESWTKYLGRRLTRGSDLFLIIYWKDSRATPSHPYRAFAELEYRRRSGALLINVAIVFLLLGILLIQPLDSISQSSVGILTKHITSYWFIGASALLAVVFRILKCAANYVNNGNIKKVRNILLRIERRWYRP